jgi:hypothetical protein
VNNSQEVILEKNHDCQGVQTQTEPARICKRLRRPGIDSVESTPPAYVAWRTGIARYRYDKNLVVGIDSWAGSLKGLQIRAQRPVSMTKCNVMCVCELEIKLIKEMSTEPSCANISGSTCRITKIHFLSTQLCSTSALHIAFIVHFFYLYTRLSASLFHTCFVYMYIQNKCLGPKAIKE